MKNAVIEVVITVAVALLIFLGVHVTFEQIIVQQISMLPNLEEGQRIFINKLALNFGEPERGDVIVFRMPEEGPIPLIKRVIGLPGEKVEVRSGKVYVNGTAIDEPYVMEPPTYSMSAITVPEGNFFVLGDNRNRSKDSHQGWTVPDVYIIGKAWATIWPLDKLGFMPDYVYAGVN